jgi:hypothetical protein
MHRNASAPVFLPESGANGGNAQADPFIADFLFASSASKKTTGQVDGSRQQVNNGSSYLV